MRPTLTARLAWLALATAAPARGQAIDRIEPPSWWAGAGAQELTLLVEGTGLEGATARVGRGPIRVVGVEAGRSGRYLFVDVVVPAGAAPGGSEIEVEAAGKVARRAWDLVAAPTRRADPIGPDDVIYLVMPDRFANGDPGNDEPAAGERTTDRGDTHAYHGGDFAGLRARLPALKDLGVTALWLTPVYRMAPTRSEVVVNGTRRRVADFHGYSPVDFYETDPHLGTLDEYRGLVDEAHRLGLKVVQDQVVGYTGPRHRWVADPPAVGWFNGTPDRHGACNFRFGALSSPHAAEADRLGLTDGWFFGILPDLSLQSPRAARYAIQQSLWWATLFEADGVRLDTYPMVRRAFWRDWSRRLEAARPGIKAVGEAWVVDPADLAFFQGGRAGWDGIDPGVASVFDFPLQAAAVAAFSGRAPASGLAKVLARDGLYPDPERLVTFLDNHDTARLASVPGVTPARLRLAAAFLLTTRGIPQLTWGDEFGLVGHMDDRRDYPVDAGRTDAERSLAATYRDLLHLRARTPALRRGTLTDLVADATTYAYLRAVGADRVVVALNLAPTTAAIDLPAPAAAVLHGPAIVRDGPRLELPAESASVVLLGPPAR